MQTTNELKTYSVLSKFLEDSLSKTDGFLSFFTLVELQKDVNKVFSEVGLYLSSNLIFIEVADIDK